MISTLKMAIAGLALPILLVAGPALATTAGHIENTDFFYGKNVTQNSALGDPVSGAAGDTLLLKVRLHNPGPGIVSAVNVKVALPTASATAQNASVTTFSTSADPQSTTDSLRINLSTAQTLTYVNGSTQLLNASGAVVSTLPDTITSSGVNLDYVGVSINEIKYVQFQVKVGAPIAAAAVTPVAPAQPQPLAKTGARENAAAVTALLAVLATAYLRSRKALAAAR